MKWEPLPKELQDFRYFLCIVWKHLNLPQPTPIQLDVANWLQEPIRRRIIEAFRGIGKSWITSAYVLYRLRLNPDWKCLVVSASKARADNFSTFTLRLINEMPVLHCLRPANGMRNSKVAFDVGCSSADQAPSVASQGIFGMLTGSRADEIIADDIEIPTNSESQAMREKLAGAVTNFDSILKPGGTVTYLGTPQTEMSLYNTLSKRGYVTRIWPARFPSVDMLPKYGDKLSPYVRDRVLGDNGIYMIGQTTEPLRFSNDDLNERQLSLGSSGFALQFMLDTSLSDITKYPLHLRDLIIDSVDPDVFPEKITHTVDPTRLVEEDISIPGFDGDRYYYSGWRAEKMLPYTGSVMAIDPSGKGKDETAYAVVKYVNGYLVLVASGGFRDGYTTDVLQELARIAADHKVKAVVVEENFGQGMFMQLLQPILYKVHKCSLEEVRHSRQKELRIIDVLEPVMNQHRLIVDRKVLDDDWNSTKAIDVEDSQKYRLFFQMTRISKARGALANDDRLDALAMAVQYWVDAMATDADKANKARDDKRLERELELYAKAAGNYSDYAMIHGFVAAEEMEKQARANASKRKKGSGARNHGNLLNTFKRR